MHTRAASKACLIRVYALQLFRGSTNDADRRGVSETPKESSRRSEITVTTAHRAPLSCKSGRIKLTRVWGLIALKEAPRVDTVKERFLFKISAVCVCVCLLNQDSRKLGKRVEPRSLQSLIYLTFFRAPFAYEVSQIYENFGIESNFRENFFKKSRQPLDIRK